MPQTSGPPPGEPQRPAAADDAELFRSAVGDAVPLAGPKRVHRRPPPPPALPVQTWRDEQEVLRESLDPGVDHDDAETGEELSFVRTGLSRLVLRKLRRGQWTIDAELDLHGMRSEEARASLADFLKHCLRRGARCVRVVHGKGRGSPNREPVLKHKVRRWLMQRDEVLAFCEARPADGGSGAAVVLLRGVGRQRPAV